MKTTAKGSVHFSLGKETEQKQFQVPSQEEANGAVPFYSFTLQSVPCSKGPNQVPTPLAGGVNPNAVTSGPSRTPPKYSTPCQWLSHHSGFGSAWSPYGGHLAILVESLVPPLTMG